MKRTVVAGLTLAVLMSGCFANSEPTTETGKGLPELTVTFPELVDAGSLQTVEIEISNPGPGDMQSLVVSFSRVGVGGGEELPEPLVDVAIRGQEQQVISIEPSPTSISADGVVYVFDGLAEGESTTIHFEVRVPNVDGRVANSVVIYDAQDVERARGVSLEAEVQR